MIIVNKYGTSHNITGTHEGTDCVFSDPVVKFPKELFRGRVIYIGNDKGSGNFIIFRCVQKDNKTIMMRMNHFKSFFCKVDDLLGPDDKIGVQGATGNATGEHVCVEFYKTFDGEDIIRKSYG